MRFQDCQSILRYANCEFFGVEVERIHPVRISSTALPIPLDGIENDDMFASPR